MRALVLVSVWAALAAAAAVVVVDGLRVEKSVVKYLGTDFVLRDGCPEPECDQAQADCIRTINMVRELFSHCVQSERGQHVGCMTDQLTSADTITVPVYASVCSAMCYESTPEALAKIQPCPHPGYRQHNLDLLKIFS